MNNELILEIKSLEEQGMFTGYAAIFGNIDRQGEVITEGAFKASLSRKRKSLPLLWQHNQSEVIGKVSEVKEDSVGLWVKGNLNLDVAKAKEVYSMLKAGDVSGMSIGYRIKNGKRKDGATYLTELDIFEASIVPIPANELAEVVSVKSQEGMSGMENELKQIQLDMKSLLDKVNEVLARQESLESLQKENINKEREDSMKAYKDFLEDLIG
jgi:HK97 family phage prohead protease